MEDTRTYRTEEEEQRRISDENERAEYGASAPDDEVPFHIPRD